jgi:hypothetical protein
LACGDAACEGRPQAKACGYQSAAHFTISSHKIAVFFLAMAVET